MIAASRKGWRGGYALAVLLVIFPARAQNTPPPTFEIGIDRPLFVFQPPGSGTDDPVVYAQHVLDTWAALPDNLKPFSAMRVDTDAPDATARQVRYRSILAPLQAQNIPIVLIVGKADPSSLHPPDQVDKLLYDFTCVKAVWVSDLSFNNYYTFGGGDSFGSPPQVQWLLHIVDTAARYGRYLILRLGAHEWPHALANSWCKPLIEKFRANAAYIVPVAGLDGDDTIAQQGMMMGLWLDGTALHWGVEASPKWFHAAHFIAPGLYGNGPVRSPMPPAFYRAMVLNGAMGGATVYAFDTPDDLWNGSHNEAWNIAIAPVLHEVIDIGLISRKDLVAKKAQVAYQLGVSNTPADMQTNLRDIDGVYGEGLMIRGAYGMDKPGQIAELIPNTGAHFWIPIISAFSDPKGFARVIKPNTVNSVGEWTQLLDQYLVPDGAGPAFVTQVGLRAFVMHTRENRYEQQVFRLPGLPSPVTGIKVVREGTSATVSWPHREGDIVYRVYRRSYPNGTFEMLADNLEQWSWKDSVIDPQQPFAYSVTAITQEKQVYEGVVNYGDYLAFSMAQSRIAEEAIISPLAMTAESQPITKPDTRPIDQQWWPNIQDVPADNKQAAREIAAAIEVWDIAFTNENLAGIIATYAPSYRDPQNWGTEYVTRAYQWFFERYNRCLMSRQIHQWDFSQTSTSGQVRVLLYCRFQGTATSDSTGRFATIHASFPMNETGEVWLTFLKTDNGWKIEHTEPALPNFREILSYASGPYDGFTPGPDVPPVAAVPIP